METLVDCPTIQIKVKDCSDMCVCTKCKGGKTINYYEYYNSDAFRTGGILSISGTKQCPQCEGRGFWRSL